MIRRIKLAYELYNFFHKKELQHNEKLYKQYGIDKKYYSSVSSQDFSAIDSEAILQQGRTMQLEDIPFYQKLDAETKQNVDRFDELGYCIIKNFWSKEKVKMVNDEIERLLDNQDIQFKYGNKLMFTIHKSELLRNACDHQDLLVLLNYLIQGDAQLFQSINFLNGSQQKTHSDSIHMTTFPLGGLLGVWIALEDIDQDNGPLHYYPTSHKFPYYLNKDYDNIGSRFFLGDKGYNAYEQMIEQKVKEQAIPKKVFTAESGDLLIWHANLLHGGEPHLNKDKTRKSMVLHYFDSRRICYHEITQRPALIKQH